MFGPTHRYYRDGQEEAWMKNEDFYGGRTGPLQCEVQRMRSCNVIRWCVSARVGIQKQMMFSHFLKAVRARIDER